MDLRRLNSIVQNLNNGMGVGCFPLYSLKRYRTVEFYEAKHTAWVFWGKPNIFNYVRLEKPSEIPKWRDSGYYLIVLWNVLGLEQA